MYQLMFCFVTVQISLVSWHYIFWFPDVIFLVKLTSHCLQSDKESDVFGIHNFIKGEIVKEADANALLYPAVPHIPVDLLRESTDITK